MQTRALRCEVVWPLIAAAVTFVGCSTEVEDPTASTPPGTGRVEAALTVAPGSGGPMVVQTTKQGAKPKVTEVIVTVAKVTAHSTAGGWQTISNKEVTVDVLKLAQYTQSLGFSNMPAGKVTQVRLYLAESGPQYVTREDGVRIDLKVPSGIQSGIKLKGVFDVQGCNLNSVPLQIDGKKSIWVHPTGQQDLWILRPVIRMGKVEASNVGCTTPVPVGGPGATGVGGGGGPGGPGGSGGAGGSGGSGGGFEEGPGNGGPGGAGGTPGGTPGPTPMSGAGGTCASNLGCLSGVCLNGTCGKSGPDAPCAVAADCASGTCASGACTINGAGGTGATCSMDSQCLSNGCVSGTCGEGGQGQPCTAAADCALGFSCVASSCTSPIN